MKIPEWISQYWIEWLFGLLCTGLVFAYNKLAAKLKRETEENKALKNGMRALLRRQIIADCEECVRQGFCPVTRKDTILDMYQCYHALGGNGTVTTVKETVMGLPTFKPECGEEKHD